MFKISTVYNQHTAKYKGVNVLEPINEQEVLNLLTSYANKPVYLHVETTNGAYANHLDEHAQLKGGEKDPYRVGLKLREGGWVYVQGLTHYEVNHDNEFLIAGFNYEGQLAATIEISDKPFTI